MKTKLRPNKIDTMWCFRTLFVIFSVLSGIRSVTLSNRFPINASQCPAFQWQCDNGDCIDVSETCDGTRNCRDGSDETTEKCMASSCPSYAFRCMYGACVSGNAECNNQQECADGSDELTSMCPFKPVQQLHGTCNLDSFQCDNRQCIGIDLLCDGKADCSDYSDEMVKYCAGQYCPSYSFRCGNGACIAMKQKCDMRLDCLDGSDENAALCGRNETITVRPSLNNNRPINNRPVGRPTTYPSSSVVDPYNTATTHSSRPSGCRADNLPLNGDAFFANEKVQYGQHFPNLTSINYTCIANHYLFGNQTNLCINGHWSFPTPECRPRCNSSEIQGVTISSTCNIVANNTAVSTSCVRPVEPGTIAHVNCQLGYQKTGAAQTLTCESTGRWNLTPQKCTPVCGEINVGSAYVVGGDRTNVSRNPWHAGVYKKRDRYGSFEQICGGTIATSKIIISAMHCFWDRSEERPFEANIFRVAVGKTNRGYDTREEHKPQFFAIERILYNDKYSDYTSNYAYDIALLVLDKHIEFHSFIVPICLPQNLEFNEQMVPENTAGITAGWGLTESGGTPSDVLKQISLPVVSQDECKRRSSPEFVKFITSDKFCAGHYLTGVSVCEGDSGGGLVFPTTIGLKTIYTLRGIVSTGGNKGGSCDNDKYTTFTNVAYFMDFINAHISRYEPKV